MKKLLIMCLVCFVAMTFISTNAFAASAKASAQFVDMQAVALNPLVFADGPAADWNTIFTQVVHTANMHDIYISPSFEVGLTTNTAVMSKKLARAIAEAEAQVQVRVLLDGEIVAPGPVTYSQRKQSLIAEFAGLYDLWGDDACYTTTTACVDDDPEVEGCQGTEVVTGITFSDDDACFDAEYLQLILSTLAAHTFNFIATDVPTGDHTIEVQALLTYDLGDGLGIYDRPDLEDDILQLGMSGSKAWIGKGSVLIDVVRMIKGEDVNLD